MYEAASYRRGTYAASAAATASAAVSVSECEKIKLRARDRLAEKLLAQYSSTADLVSSSAQPTALIEQPHVVYPSLSSPDRDGDFEQVIEDWIPTT